MALATATVATVETRKILRLSGNLTNAKRVLAVRFFLSERLKA
jgi:hypothetical protein